MVHGTRHLTKYVALYVAHPQAVGNWEIHFAIIAPTSFVATFPTIIRIAYPLRSSVLCAPH